MKLKIVLAMFLMAISFSKPTMATQATIFGAPNCGQWVKSPSTSDKAWLLGFMSGLSLYTDGKDDWLDKIASAEQIYLWMDSYCRANPLKKLNHGGLELARELQKMK